MLTEAFGIKKGDIVSIVGSSGKTALMLGFAKELRDSKVLVTTTTKIYLPKPYEYDHLCIGYVSAGNGITAAAQAAMPNNKLKGLAPEHLSRITGLFDYTFIESDGANEKPLKAWGAHEPVVLPETSKTIGVISVRLVGAEINETNTHRYEIFKKYYLKEDTLLTIEHLCEVITNKNGLFKNSAGERMLYINMVETDADTDNAERLAEALSGAGFAASVIYGSLKEGWIIRVNGGA